MNKILERLTKAINKANVNIKNLKPKKIQNLTLEDQKRLLEDTHRKYHQFRKECGLADGLTSQVIDESKKASWKFSDLISKTKLIIAVGGFTTSISFLSFASNFKQKQNLSVTSSETIGYTTIIREHPQLKDFPVDQSIELRLLANNINNTLKYLKTKYRNEQSTISQKEFSDSLQDEFFYEHNKKEIVELNNLALLIKNKIENAIIRGDFTLDETFMVFIKKTNKKLEKKLDDLILCVSEKTTIETLKQEKIQKHQDFDTKEASIFLKSMERKTTSEELELPLNNSESNLLENADENTEITPVPSILEFPLKIVEFLIKFFF